MITTTVLILSIIWMLWMGSRVNAHTGLATIIYNVIPLLLSIALIIILVVDNIELIKEYL